MASAGIVRELSRRGLLLKQDKRLPNVVTLVTGESLTRSWWGHPKARLIFATLAELSEHPDVLFTKLLFGKVTLVHRALWPAFLAVATSSEAWQLRGLPHSSHSLLRALLDGQQVQATGPTVKELEKRLLVSTAESHTKSGRHALTLETWRTWAARARCRPLSSVPAARRAIEQATEQLGAPLLALPWVSAVNTSA